MLPPFYFECKTCHILFYKTATVTMYLTVTVRSLLHISAFIRHFRSTVIPVMSRLWALLVAPYWPVEVLNSRLRALIGRRVAFTFRRWAKHSSCQAALRQLARDLAQVFKGLVLCLRITFILLSSLSGKLLHCKHSNCDCFNVVQCSVN